MSSMLAVSKESAVGDMSGQTISSSTLEMAQLYLRSGLQPLALQPNSKAPRSGGWTKRMLDEDDLLHEFAPSDNIGLLCGMPSRGLVDVDIDDETALRSFSKWLPPTSMCHGRPSMPRAHHWFIAEGDDFRVERFSDPAGGAVLIEIRGTGGQTMVPPSVHPSGELLTWSGALEPATISLGELRNAVLRIAAATLLVRHWPAQGGRHAAALALGGALLRAGMETEAAASLVEEVAAAAGDEEAEDRGTCVRTTAAKHAKGEATTGFRTLAELIGTAVAQTAFRWLKEASVVQDAQLWELPVPFDGKCGPDIPATLVPGPVGRFAGALAATAEVPEAMPVFMALSVVATAAAGRWVVMPKEGWTEHLNIYTAVAMEPGNNKSLVVRNVVRPLVDWESARSRELGPEIAKAKSRRKTEEKIVEQKRRDVVKCHDPEEQLRLIDEVAQLEAQLTDVPVLPKLFANDATPESLVANVAEQGGRFAIISDEGGITETMAGLYTNGAANVDILLKGIDGGTVRVLRKDRALDVNPLLTVGMAIQPQILMNMAQRKAFHGNGLLDRFLFVMPTSRLGYRTHEGPPIPAQVEREYGELIQRLLADGSQRSGAAILMLEASALNLWQTFRHEIEAGLRAGESLAAMTGWAAKLAGFTLRLAGLLHLSAGKIDDRIIDEPSMRGAIDIARLTIEHRNATVGIMGSEPAVGDARRIFEWVVQAEPSQFTRTEVSRAVRGLGPKQLDAALRVLSDRSIIAPRDLAKTGKPGRPPVVYDVNPRLFADHES